jgi:hypothetical protein
MSLCGVSVMRVSILKWALFRRSYNVCAPKLGRSVSFELINVRA